MKSGVFLVAFCARLKTYGALFGDKNHKAFSRFCLCGHEKSGLERLQSDFQRLNAQYERCNAENIDLQQEKQSLRNQLDSTQKILAEQLATVRAEVESISAAYTQLKQEKLGIENELLNTQQILGDKLSNAQSEIEVLSSSNVTLQQGKQELEAQLRKAQQVLGDQLSAALVELETLSASYEEAQQDKVKSEAESRALRQSLDDQLSAALVELETLSASYEEAQQDKVKSEAESRALRQSLDDQLSAALVELETLSASYEEVQQDKVKGEAELRALRQSLDDQLSATRIELQSLSVSYNSLLAEKQANLALLQEANAKYRLVTGENIPALKQKLESQTRRSAELHQQVMQLNQELKQIRQLRADALRALAAIKASLTYRSGLYLRQASGSFVAALKLPVRLWRLRAEVKRGASEQEQAASAIELPAAAIAVDQRALFTQALEYKPAREVRVACVMDDFTFASYQPECDLHQLTPENWLAELEACKPELLFIESAWRGKDGLWGSKIGHCSQELQGIVAWCREQHVPTLFWNKEDPVHFETFLTTAKLFDFVFTTDMDCIHRYKAALGHERVYFLPFACQPAVHNPIEKYTRKDAFCFAGAYYVRYPERTRDLESFVSELPAYRPFEIYDRNFGKDDPNYQFPEAYQPYIVGTLPFTEIDKAYKGYRYAINLNSIKQSQSMFARRVYELLGSNTLTISNFSRGVRLMFGDLVVASDSGVDIKRRLDELQAGNQVDRLRLAGLRKAMSEHTYTDRLAYVLQQVTGKPRHSSLPSFVVLATAQNLDDLKSIAAHVARQQGVTLSLKVIVRRGVSIAEAEACLQQLSIPCTLMVAKALRRKSLQDLVGTEPCWIAGMQAGDYYGPNYLLDMALATRYSPVKVIGKAAWHICSEREGQPQVELYNADDVYTSAKHLFARCAVIASESAGNIPADKWLAGIDSWQYELPEQLAIDPFNYCQRVAPQHWPEVARQVDDLQLDNGVPLAQLTDLAESVQAMEVAGGEAASLNGNQLVQLLLGNGLNFGDKSAQAQPEGPVTLSRSTAINVSVSGSVLQLESTLADGKHEYLYAKKDIAVADVQTLLADNSGAIPIHLELDPGLNLSLVLLYLDAGKERLGHVVLLPNRNLDVELPEDTAFLRFGLRVYAGGSSTIKRLIFGHLDLEPVSILGQSDVLLLTNHYPSYDDLYRNGFVHSRVKAYREHGVEVDVFRLRKDQPISWHEFQDVDVTTGSQNALRRMLASGRYRHVLVHFLDPDMWDVLKDFIDRIKVTVWVHGAEIHPWYRRKFNIETPEQEEKAKAQSEIRMAFWKGLLEHMPANLHMVFVSRTFAGEVQEDLGFELPEAQYSIIHNPIDTERFNYIEKDPEQRKRILSIRPFATKQYANDISVKCLQQLAESEIFNDLQIRIIGDGALFDETLEPLRKYPNIQIERRFVSHEQIAELHKEYGIFLCPTRWDSQGVSRDEAMASGLVPITNALAAIPEFADETCAVLAVEEDYQGMAKGIATLVERPDLFVAMSERASLRVKQQTAKSIITQQEISNFAK
ncbi:glycosyltransferase family protein [Ectopseudomonas oleovorans]|uniref:glycosyltransferase family protein n=1 Tax=Ectopseudomonas oleovorans TaxID=301 RepID=UPI0002736CEB|nr:glycosyltransferase [Pseudomonas oleovorans]